MDLTRLKPSGFANHCICNFISLTVGLSRDNATKHNSICDTAASHTTCNRLLIAKRVGCTVSFSPNVSRCLRTEHLESNHLKLICNKSEQPLWGVITEAGFSRLRWLYPGNLSPCWRLWCRRICTPWLFSSSNLPCDEAHLPYFHWQRVTVGSRKLSGKWTWADVCHKDLSSEYLKLMPEAASLFLTAKILKLKSFISGNDRGIATWVKSWKYHYGWSHKIC